MNMRDQEQRFARYLIIAIAGGLFLRLLLMPFFAHVDFFSEYRRVFFALQSETSFPAFNRLVVFYIEYGFAWLFQWFIHDPATTFYLADPLKSTAGLTDYFMFVGDPHVFRHLFLLKIPYLIFDMATVGVLWKFFDSPQQRLLAICLWLFNPITLYSFYIFGRFECIAIFFLAMAALSLRNGKFVWSAVWIGVAINCREIYVLVVPYYLLALIRFDRTIISNAARLLPCILVIGVALKLPGLIGSWTGATPLFVGGEAIAGLGGVHELFSFQHHWFYPMIFGFTALAFYLWEIGKRPSDERFVIGAAICLCWFIAISTTSAHYASWLVLFPILALRYQKQMVFPLLVIFLVWFVLWCLRTDTGVFTAFLAMPMSTDFFLMKTIPELYLEHIHSAEFTLERAINGVRTMLTTTLLFAIWRLVKKDA